MTTDPPPPVENEQEAAPAERRRLLAISAGVLLIGLWALLQLFGLGDAPFHTKGEPREALVVWEMTHGGGWVLPRRNGTEVPSKPPLFHWLGALTALSTGRTDEWSIRFPSVALSLAGVLGTYAAGTALWGPPAGFVGATVVLTSFEWQRTATSARVDMTLTFGLLSAFFAYLFFVRSGGHAAWTVTFYAGMAFAVLAKGPVGVALPALLVAASCLTRRELAPLRRLRPMWGLIAVALITGLWYALALFEGGPAFFFKQILNENVLRFTSASEFSGGHRHSPLYLVGALAAGFLPWTLFLPGVAVTLWRQRRGLKADDPRVYLVLWIVVIFGFYSTVVSKRSVYLLPLYPALGLLVGWWWTRMIQYGGQEAAEDVGWLRTGIRWLAWVAMAAVAAVLVSVIVELAGVTVVGRVAGPISQESKMYGEWVSDILRASPGLTVALLAAAAACLWQVASALCDRRWGRAFVALVTAVCAAGLLTRNVILPGIAARKTYRDFMHAARHATGNSAELFFFRTFDYGAVFYWGQHIRPYAGGLSPDAPRHLLMTHEEWERATPIQREWFERVMLPAEEEEGQTRRLVLVRRQDA